MGSLRAVGTIAGNNLRRTVRAPIMLFTTLVLPFLVIAVVGFALGGSRGELRAGLQTDDHSTLGRGLDRALHASTGLDVVGYSSRDAMERAVRRGEVSAGITIPAGYGGALEAGRTTSIRLVTTPNQTRAASIRALVQSAVNSQVETVQAAVFSHVHTGRSIAAETVRARFLRDHIPAPTISRHSVDRPAADALGFDYTAPSNLVLFVVITSLTSAGSLIETRMKGITARTFTMPIRRTAVILGELAGRFLIAVLQALIILVFSSLLFGVSWGSPVGVGVLTASMCAFGAAVGMLVGFSARTVAQAVSFGPPLGIVLGMLGGCMWPLSIVAPVVRTIGHITPQAWAMDGYLKLLNDRVGIAGVAPQVLAVLAFTAGVLTLATVVITERSMP